MDVRRLIEIIVEEMADAGVTGRQHACSCHGFLYDCCPDRVRGVLDGLLDIDGDSAHVLALSAAARPGCSAS